MLNLDIDSLKTNTRLLESYINSYEENTMTIAYELQQTEPNWRDQNSRSFFEKLLSFKRQMMAFNNDLTNIAKNYEKIIDDVERIDKTIKKVFVDASKQTKIIATYNDSIKFLTKARDRLSRMNTGVCSSSQYNTIRREINNLNNSISRLEASKRRVETMYKRLGELEQKISITFSKISVSTVNLLDLSRY